MSRWDRSRRRGQYLTRDGRRDEPPEKVVEVTFTSRDSASSALTEPTFKLKFSKR